MASSDDSTKIILLDIEGTVCPISFVKDVLYPFSQKTLADNIEKQWDDPAIVGYRSAFPEEHRSSPKALLAHVQDLVDADVKAPYLKALQGHLWKEGYASGQLRAPLFPDVPPAIAAWRSAGVRIAIYSSGSVPAQKLFFGHTDADPSDLQPWITGWFDTVNAGPKTETASYAAIAAHYPDVPPAQWLFLSDNLKEVEAALASGMQSRVVVRPGNQPIPDNHPLLANVVTDFSTIKTH